VVLAFGALPSLLEVGSSTTFTATVTTAGPARAVRDVRVTVAVPTGLSVPAAPAGCSLATAVVVCPLGTLPAGQTRTVRVAAVASAVGTHVVTATAITGTPDDVPADNTQTAAVQVVPVGTLPHADLAVTLSRANRPAYVGATKETMTIAVTNRGPQVTPDVSLETTYPDFVKPVGAPGCVAGGPPCSLGAFGAGETRTFTVTMSVLKIGTGTITARVTGRSSDPNLADNETSLPLTAKQASLRLLPPIGEPGFVTLAFGENMPPGGRVMVMWDKGVTAAPGPYTVGPDGTVRIPVLVVRRDALGERLLVATSPDGIFGPVHRTMLVVPRTVSVATPVLVGRAGPVLGRN
jgi:hypothetical protein